MGKLLDRVRSIWNKLNTWSEQVYSSKELKSLLLFLAIGVTVLLYRGGKTLYYTINPELTDSSYRVKMHREDSLFAVLSTKRARQDSFIFYRPKDTLERSVVKLGEDNSSTNAPLLQAESVSLSNQTVEQPKVQELKPAIEKFDKSESNKGHIININSAKLEELVRLPSIGEVTAKLILDYRSERGRFRSIEELMNVKGIGVKRLERIKPYLRLD